MKINNINYVPNKEAPYNVIKGFSAALMSSVGIPPTDSLSAGDEFVRQIKLAQLDTGTKYTFQAEYIKNAVKSAIKKFSKILK